MRAHALAGEGGRMSDTTIVEMPGAHGVIGERTFRDAAQGFMVWAIGVVAMLTVAGLLGLHAFSTTAQVATGLTSAFAGNTQSQSAGGTGPAGSATNTSVVDYYVDAMF